MTVAQVRRESAKVFGNEKLVEVVLALDQAAGVATAQEITRRTGIAHSMVRDVLVRLADAALVRPLPRESTRAAQYYDTREQGEVWTRLVALAHVLWARAEVGPAPVAEMTLSTSGSPSLPPGHDPGPAGAEREARARGAGPSAAPEAPP